MIRLLTGKTGSGKSFKAVSLILESLENNRNVYTNIKIDYDHENYHYIDELGVRAFLTYIEKTFEDVLNLDEKKAEVNATEYFESDFFIDEAHLVGFKKSTDSILNWLTIHRHFNQNITVITQIPSNVHRNYLDLFHNHIEMIPPNKRLSKSSMGFKEYDSFNGDRLRTHYFKPNLEIFELYNSGNVETGVNQVVYKLGMLLGGFVLIGLVLYSLSSDYFDKLHKYDDFNGSLPTVNINGFVPAGQINNILSDKNITIVKTFNVWCDTVDGCYIDGKHYSYTEFLFYYLKNKVIENKQIVLSDKDWRMEKYTFRY